VSFIEGRADASGTAAFVARSGVVASTWRGLQLGPIGVGTYLGDSDEVTDRAYAAGIARAVEQGANLIDTALSYRCQRSERVVGRVLGERIAAGGLRRNQVLVTTKAGYLAADGAPPADPHEYCEATYYRSGILDRTQLVQRSHSIAPRFLADQLERSRRNLGLATVDVFFLHNPETQLAEVSPGELHRRLRDAFAFCETAAAEGRIGGYGVATWDGLRKPDGGLALGELLALAREVGGASHRFVAVELPFSLAMPEAFTAPHYGGRSLLAQASDADLLVLASAPILQGRLAALELAFPDSGLESSAQHALQLVRSAPGVTAALVGARDVAHVDENARVARLPPLSPAQVAELLDL
jgi:aryl-alcohol dehydrogenase-like predicted oxidoreductase